VHVRCERSPYKSDTRRKEDETLHVTTQPIIQQFMWVSKTKAAILKFRQFIWIKPNMENLLTRLKTLWNKKGKSFQWKLLLYRASFLTSPHTFLYPSSQWTYISFARKDRKYSYAHIYFRDRKTVDLIFSFPNISSRIIDENMLYVFSELRLNGRRK
jgi:hypothetical protein